MVCSLATARSGGFGSVSCCARHAAKEELSVIEATMYRSKRSRIDKDLQCFLHVESDESMRSIQNSEVVLSEKGALPTSILHRVDVGRAPTVSLFCKDADKIGWLLMSLKRRQN